LGEKISNDELVPFRKVRRILLCPNPANSAFFLCHASQDKPIVRELYQRLLAEGWIDPWLDEEKLLPGSSFYPVNFALSLRKACLLRNRMKCPLPSE
jgi:hypothetical protein